MLVSDPITTTAPTSLPSSSTSSFTVKLQNQISEVKSVTDTNNNHDNNNKNENAVSVAPVLNITNEDNLNKEIEELTVTKAKLEKQYIYWKKTFAKENGRKHREDEIPEDIWAVSKEYQDVSCWLYLN